MNMAGLKLFVVVVTAAFVAGLQHVIQFEMEEMENDHDKLEIWWRQQVKYCSSH